MKCIWEIRINGHCQETGDIYKSYIENYMTISILLEMFTTTKFHICGNLSNLISSFFFCFIQMPIDTLYCLYCLSNKMLCLKLLIILVILSAKINFKCTSISTHLLLLENSWLKSKQLNVNSSLSFIL